MITNKMSSSIFEAIAETEIPNENGGYDMLISVSKNSTYSLFDEIIKILEGEIK